MSSLQWFTVESDGVMVHTCEMFIFKMKKEDLVFGVVLCCVVDYKYVHEGTTSVVVRVASW